MAGLHACANGERSLTASGAWAWGTGGEAGAKIEKGFQKKVAKAEKAASAKQVAADKARLKVVRACGAAAVAEARLLSGIKLEKLNGPELKDLLVGRGGKPQGNKAKLIEMLEKDYSQPQL